MNDRLYARVLLAVSACLAAAASTGCAPKYANLQAFTQQHDHDVAASSYRIEPPDVVVISSPTSPEVDNEYQRIRSDGKISLKLLGEVKVSGLTPRELAAKIEELLARYYVSPKVNVRVASYESQKIYVFGEVNSRGAMAFTGRDTVMDALARAQPNFIAWGSQVKVIRPSASPSERHEIIVDIDKMTQSGDLKKNVLLQSGDIVYVPPTPLGWIGLRVQELLFPFSPALNAYQSGASIKATNDVYYGNNDSGGNDDSNLRRDLLLLLR